MFIDRDTTTIILNSHGLIGMDSHRNRIGIASHHLIDTIINHLLNEVVQSTLVGRANVHTGAYTNGL